MTTLALLRLVFAAGLGVWLYEGGLRAAEPAPSAPPVALPRFVDLGADKCIPCKMMAPIIADLAKDYAGQLNVMFIDVWKNPGEGQHYGIQVIPTQIFYDATDKERFRHEGFMPKKDILAKWRELGVELKAPAAERKS